MAAEFVGYTGVEHAWQEEESELCFATFLKGMTGTSIAEAHVELLLAGLSKGNGLTGPLASEAKLELGGYQMAITPLETPEDSSAVMDLLDEQFEDGKAVALLYKKTANPEDDAYHWILLTGYLDLDGRKDAIHVIDTLRDENFKPLPGEEARYLGRPMIRELIKRSTDYENGGMGIFPHAISTASPPSFEPARKLAVVYAFDQEPEPIEDTYTATKQAVSPVDSNLTKPL